MRAEDFEGLFAYKLLIPAFTWWTIVSTFLGPLFYPTLWFCFAATYMVIFVIVSSTQASLVLPVSEARPSWPALVAWLWSNGPADAWQVRRMINMTSSIRRTCLEEDARQRAEGGMGVDAGEDSEPLKGAGGTRRRQAWDAADGGSPASLDSDSLLLSVAPPEPFLHAFIIPNYQVHSRSSVRGASGMVK